MKLHFPSAHGSDLLDPEICPPCIMCAPDRETLGQPYIERAEFRSRGDSPQWGAGGAKAAALRAAARVQPDIKNDEI